PTSINLERAAHKKLHTLQIPFAPKFLGFFLNSSSFHQQLLPLMQGTKVVSISKSSIKDRRVYFPSERKEQESIADFFSHLNSLLTLHQRQQNGGYLWLENSAKQVCFAIITASGYRSTKKALSDQLR
uniref:restriction endonuclease subunit S n=1 Tax=Mesosutterella multiformis TaxID=2259133 RepID=UPI004028F4FC